MKTILIFFIIITASPLVNATQFEFESVIDAMSIKANDSHTNNDWEATTKIRFVKWEWPYFESGEHDHTMKGKAKIGNDKNPNIGTIRINVNGVRNFITDVEISVSNKEQDMSALGDGKKTKILTSCDEDSALSTVSFYKFERQKYKPLYVSYISSWGASGSGEVDFKIAYQLEDILHIYPNPCRVL